MRPNKPIRAVVLTFCIVSLVLLGINADRIINWLYAPIEITLSEREEASIYENVGVKIPDQGCFLHGYKIPGQEPVFMYVFEFEYPMQHDDISCDSYVRRQLGLDDAHYSGTLLIDSSLYRKELVDLGYPFTHTIQYTEKDFSEICYYIENEVLYVALIYSL